MTRPDRLRSDPTDMQRLLSTCLFLLALPASALAQVTCGSPVIDRPIDDASSGLIYLYRGGTQPLVGPGRIERWSFFNNETVGNAKVTPLLFEQTAAQGWKVVAIGTSRSATNQGIQTHDFQTLVGSPDLAAGKQYTVGFTHRGYTLSGPNLVPDAGYGGVVDFSGYGLTTDVWSYVFTSQAAALGSQYGTGGAPLDSQGLAGRIYSVRFELAGITNLPGCAGNPASLSASATKLTPGTATQLSLSSPTLPSGVALCLVGVPAVDGAGCGLFLPGIGELLFAPGSEFVVSNAALVGGSAALPLSIPSQPSLIGKKVLLQGVAGGVVGPNLAVALSNGLSATISP
jgi:hypothetical protein